MIFAHLLIGILLSIIYGNYTPFILGSILPDIDHLYIALKNNLWKKQILIDSLKHETKYGIRYKTKLVHSLLGLMLFSLILFPIFKNKTIYFSIAYLLHLLLDWVDIDEKYYLYPLSVKFKGFLPIWSKPERIFTAILLFSNWCNTLRSCRSQFEKTKIAGRRKRKNLR